MTPEEKVVVQAARHWVAKGKVYEAVAAERLRLAVQALKISQRPLEGPEVAPCGYLSNTGRMTCVRPVGHDADDDLHWRPAGPYRRLAVRFHEGRAVDGSARLWREFLFRDGGVL